jgi:hypothetical protein
MSPFSGESMTHNQILPKREKPYLSIEKPKIIREYRERRTIVPSRIKSKGSPAKIKQCQDKVVIVKTPA